MKQQSFLNKTLCVRCAKAMREAVENGGVEDYNSGKIIITPRECEVIADQFEIARRNGGNYLCNIVTTTFYTYSQIEALCEYLTGVVCPRALN